ncbi:hypothetical protein C0992_011679, partial [Termitomyces sp. T32_za158]
VDAVIPGGQGRWGGGCVSGEGGAAGGEVGRKRGGQARGPGVPDDRSGDAADLYDVLNVPSIIDTSDTPDSSPPNGEKQNADAPAAPPDVRTNSVPDEPRRSTQLAAKRRDAPELHDQDSSNSSDNPESEEETFASMPGALSTQLLDPDNLWVPKLYSKVMRRPDLWKEPRDQEMEMMRQWKVWRLVERPTGARTMKNR